MKSIPNRWTLALTLLMLASLSHAEVEFVGLDPAQPQAGEPVSMILHYAGCDLLHAGQEVSQSGNTIRAIVDGVRSDGFCVIPSTQGEFPIGQYDVGNWLLQIDYRYDDPVSGNIVIETIDTITFAVAPAPGGNVATPVP